MKSKLFHLSILLLLPFGSVGCNAPVTTPSQASELMHTASPSTLSSSTSLEHKVISTPIPEAEQLLTTKTATPSTHPTLAGEPCLNEAAFVLDLTVPDETVFSPGEVFTKSWRLKNAGSCHWTRDYGFVFAYGSRMGAYEDLPMPGDVAPGESVDLKLQMTAPDQSGAYQGNWLLRDGHGVTFGIGPGSDTPFWVNIRVIDGLATPSGDTPAAGICPEVEGPIATMTINPDVPDPRCMVVHGDQRLRVINGLEVTLTVSLGRLTATIAPGDEYTFELPFGQLLMPGVHYLGVSPCCQGGGAIWLQKAS